MNHRNACSVLGAAAALFTAAHAVASEPTVTVENVRSATGELRIGVFDAADRLIMGKAVPSASDRTTMKLDVPPGGCALKLHHDEDGDGRFETDACGAPLEGCGFSNEASASHGLPTFGEMRVTVGDAPASGAATMHY